MPMLFMSFWRKMAQEKPCEWNFIASISVCFPGFRSVLGGHFLCFFCPQQKQKLKGYNVLYRQQRKGWSMSQHYWPGDMGLSEDKLCWRDDQAYSKLCLASSAVWALKSNPALSQVQKSGLYRLGNIGLNIAQYIPLCNAQILWHIVSDNIWAWSTKSYVKIV